jgi:hypothetical protein
MGSFLFSDLSLSLYCVCSVFFCHLCLFLFFPWFLGSLSVSCVLCFLFLCFPPVCVFVLLCSLRVLGSLPSVLPFFFPSVLPSPPPPVCEFVLWRRRRSWGTLVFSVVFLPLFLFRLPLSLSCRFTSSPFFCGLLWLL